MELLTTPELRNAISTACSSLETSVHAFKILCAKSNYQEKVVELTKDWKEIFPDIMAKVIFPDKSTGNKQIMLKAKAGSTVDLHKMVPTRFIYVIYGEQHMETGIIVYEDEVIGVKSLEETSMFYPVDTKIIMDISNDD